MKYIRTKDDTIYQVYDKVFEYKGDKRYQLTDSRFEISLKDIVNQADTIERLCDFIFVKDEYGDYKLYDLKDWANTDKEYLKESWIYGWLKELYYCIKTDKGLIYVATMNKKGELELL